MTKQHLFIIDPVKNLKPDLDTSLNLAANLNARGQKAYFCYASDLSWSCPEKPAVTAFRGNFDKGLHQISFEEKTRFLLSDFAAIHMRKEPPFDLRYLTLTWMLDQVGTKTVVLNNPRGLRAINEKVGTMHFASHTIPTLLSSNANELLDFAKSHGGDVILKPLEWFGGRGVKRIQLGESMATENAKRVLEAETLYGEQFRLIQPFLPAIFEGEVRCFALGGKPMAWCLKKPQANQYLANTSAGATLHSYKPSAAEMEAATAVSEQLRLEFGIEVVGYDMIGGKITEINVTSPRLLKGKDDPTDYYEKFGDWVISRV